ncbi:orotidine 5'-phosphate decarboxylase / HUMPS family protein [Clostridium sp. AM58-1XD]|uniref:orotidine 5'-phosphate decarboxylase / HUMPS family protein n=1 Tax=Clostridium sp. AM58-1XD TaxID=2292307 RepID=UPI0015F3913F|nr:orotidine 5'-phosphate decarboxylase / HUMPS family protein [Clostridium sp. AM58-1XD]
MIPKLQYALDTKTIEETLTCLSGGIGEQADVIEIGTSAIFSEGNKVIKCVKALYPDKEIVADVKMLMPTARGSVPPLLDAGADAVIAIGSTDETMIATAVDEICVKRNKKMYTYIHVENQEPVQDQVLDKWKRAGITNVIYHSVNPGFMWNENDTNMVERLCGYGFLVTVTGKLQLERIKDFKGLPIYSFIVGTAIRNAENPLNAVKEFKEMIRNVFS